MPSNDLRRVDHALVYKGDVAAGTISRRESDVVFEYHPDYPAHHGAVARTLPVREAPYVERGGAVPPFFAGLLPEGRRLTAIRSQLKTSADDEFTQLVAVGSDCIGDIRVLVSDAPERFSPPEVPSEAVSFRDLFSEILRDRPLDDGSVPGVQDKISDSMISVPVVGRYGPAIVKLSPADYPRIVENEAFFLGLAKQCGLSVPRHEIVRDAAGESALVVERFDRVVAKGHTQRLPQEDAVQLMGRWPAAKYLITTRDVFDTVSRSASAPLPELVKLVKLFALSYVIGNGDLHGKNVSLYHSDGLWRLTPAYDILSTLPYGDRAMALDFEARDDNIRRRDVLAIAGRVGLNERSTLKAITDVCTACANAIHQIGEIGFDERKTEDLKRTMAKRIADLSA
jgi:serine/threonine-protein kinase HipA